MDTQKLSEEISTHLERDKQILAVFVFGLSRWIEIFMSEGADQPGSPLTIYYEATAELLQGLQTFNLQIDYYLANLDEFLNKDDVAIRAEGQNYFAGMAQLQKQTAEWTVKITEFIDNSGGQWASYLKGNA